jgi:CTP synthase (UTP-ammonia lyase)
MKISIALIGVQDDSVTAHQAIPLAIGLAADALQIDTTIEWVSTEAVSSDRLSQFHAIWCVPDSPYKNAEGALTAIQFARRNDIPFLGTCGGYQHAILEFAQPRDRNTVDISPARRTNRIISRNYSGSRIAGGNLLSIKKGAIRKNYRRLLL